MTLSVMLKILFVLTPLILGFAISAFFKPTEWYKNLQKPEYIPPSVVFSIVWSILYLLFGISMYYGIYYKKLIYWIIPIFHLIVNMLFTPVMFGINNLLWAFIITVMTLVTCIMIMWQFYITKSNMISIYLLIPYLLWLMFATYLAYDIYMLNKI
jgi:translocator protein